VEQNPAEVSRSSDSKEVAFVEYNQIFHYRVHKSLLLVPILNRMNPVQSSIPYFLKMDFKICLQYAPRFYRVFPHAL